MISNYDTGRSVIDLDTRIRLVISSIIDSNSGETRTRGIGTEPLEKRLRKCQPHSILDE